MSGLSALPGLLLPWYEENRRDLPWRRDRDPYHVWLSEIMLQQTRVEAVVDYYHRFLRALPTVEALADADEETLLKLWEGLGYYNRARNLQKAARVVMKEYGGAFPQTLDAIRALPGVGPYTAGAIGSICFDLPAPAVDGNVLRVFARFTGYEKPVNTDEAKKEVTEALRPLYIPGRAGALTQSLMELGATVCVPNGAPNCERCPVKDACFANKTGDWRKYPVKTEKKARRAVDLTVLLLRCGGRFALAKRPARGLLAGLWEFPNAPLKDPADALNEAAALAAALGAKPAELLRQTAYTHVFTHVEWRVHAFYFACAAAPEAFTWATAEELESVYAIPSAFRPVAEMALEA